MKPFVIVLALLALILLPENLLFGHCDTMNGPVVIAAQKTLETGNVNLVLIWVQKDDEAVIKDAFTKTLNVRKFGPEAKKLADMYFFETVVRIHRAGEGEPYTGLKPSGYKTLKGIMAADKSIESRSIAAILKEQPESSHARIKELFNEPTARDIEEL